jgi:hypothetical protein
MKLNRLWAPLAGAIAITIAGATPAMAVDPSPAVMDLTGTPKLGEHMTVAFKTGENPVGDYFDIWMCPNKNVLPVDGGETGDCVSPTFWPRSEVPGFPGGDPQTIALSMKWLLADENVPGLNPNTDAAYLSNSLEPINVAAPDQASGGWCAYAGWYIIVNDFDEGLNGTGGYGHSNWSEAFSSEGCTEGAGGGSNSLADTGASSTAGIVAGSLGLAAIAGGVLLVRARRLRAQLR